MLKYCVNEKGNLDFFSLDGYSNYISSSIELENMKTKENPNGIIFPFGTISFDITGDKKWKGVPEYQKKGELYCYENDVISTYKQWIEKDGMLFMKIGVENISSDKIEISDLSVSIPFNNNYTRYMYNQPFMYENRTCEHYYDCGESSFVIAEKLNGRQPLCFLICGENTYIESFCKNEESVKREARGLINHSYPGSLEARLIAGKYLKKLGKNKPLWLDGTIRILAAGEKTEFVLQLGFCGNRNQFDKMRVSRGDIVLKPITSLILPIGLDFIIEIMSETDVNFSCENGKVKSIGNGRYSVSFDTTGEQSMWCFNANKKAYITFYVTDDIEKLIKSRASFILRNQIYRKDGDILDWAIVPYSEGEFVGHNGLVVEEGSLWGTGSYEGGICDAGFAAEKNVLYPDKEEISILEDYIENYVLRYLQNSENLNVNWFGFRRAENRSYNYVHVANLYYSMYRIGELYGLTKKDKLFYLDMADRTIRRMYRVSRGMDLVVGNMNAYVIFEILDAFMKIGAIDRYFDLKLDLMRNIEDVFRDTPYASECPYDNTGYETIMRYCILNGRKDVALELYDIICTNKGNQPLWWWNGSDIRWWDAEFDFRESCHHYTSPANGAAIINILADTEWEIPDESALSSAYAGLMGLCAKIREDGFGSMCYGPDPLSVNYKFHRCTGDFGVGGIVFLKNLTAFALCKNGIKTEYLCKVCENSYSFPKNSIRTFCRYDEGEKIKINIDNGFFEKISIGNNVVEIDLNIPYGDKTSVTLNANQRVKKVSGAKVYEKSDNVYVLDFESKRKKAASVIIGF